MKNESVISCGKLPGVMRAYAREIFLLTGAGLLSSLFFLSAPYFSKLFIDGAFLNKDWLAFVRTASIGGLVFLFSMALKFVEESVRNRVSTRMEIALSSMFLRKVLMMELGYFRAGRAGEQVYRFGDTQNIVSFLTEQAPRIILNLLQCALILTFAAFLNLKLTALLLLLSPVFFLHSLFVRRKLLPLYERLWQTASDLSAAVHEVFANMDIVKTLGLEQRVRHQYMRGLLTHVRWRVKNQRFTLAGTFLSTFLAKVVYGSVTLYGGWMIINSQITLGSYTAAMIYLTQVGSLLQSFADSWQSFQRERVSACRFFELVASTPAIRDERGALAPQRLQGRIVFSGVSFGYDGRRQILRDADFELAAGQWVGVVGPSGSGKTTLVSLILRLYEAGQGSIEIDGMPLTSLRLSALRSRMAAATQDPLLFDLSMEENITVGLKHVTRAQVTEAARIACIDDYISALPRGYDSKSGEAGATLSRGLKQRLAIARAVVRMPDVLVLDEATASLDPLTERQVLSNLRRQRQGLTTIIVSHRSANFRDADRIVFLDGSGKVSCGTHEQLSENGLYRDLFL